MVELHTILGASGTIGRTIISDLQSRNLPIRAVSRSMTFDHAENCSANLMDLKETIDVVNGSSHVYLCVGLTYDSKIWAKEWPLLMKNVIEACEQAKAVLIFLDNVYIYGELSNPFDESHPIKPHTKKGKIREHVANMMLDAMQSNKIRGVIARAADFFGPYAVNSGFYHSFLERMLEGKSPQSLLIKGTKHTYANTIDVGKAMVLLALDEQTYGQVWHTPVGEPVTVDDICGMFNKVLNSNYSVSYIPPFMKKILSLFITPVKEVEEMIYQFKSDYIMSDKKFNHHFPDFKPTTYEAAIKSMVESFR